ncbi:hypothetical protein FRB99_004997 [Tulasnella sp. 403]|nr:hypothetical protein FRB99_004997 [Tulasnella sp. 403]
MASLTEKSSLNAGNTTPQRASSVIDTARDGQATLNDTEATSQKTSQPLGGLQFWLVIVSIMMATFVGALDSTAISTGLPTIVEKLNGREFVWVGSAYNLASTAFLPMSGGLAQIFGRRPVILGALALFMLGSGLCAGSKSLNMLIAGRTIQGLGSGGIISLSEIIIADLVPLRQRGVYMGFLGIVWSAASASGPPIGGAISERDWRWLFYMNVPLTGVAIVLIALFLHVKAPKDDFRTKMKRMDWVGNFLVIAASSSIIIALTWGGARYEWDSFRVLVPLILGIVGLVAFFIYEFLVPLEPVVPLVLFKSPTSSAGFLMVFLQGIIVTGVVYYLPVYFQAVKLQSPLGSGVSFLPTATTVAPASIVVGATVTISNRYRPQNFVGWVLLTVGVGILTLLRADTPKGKWVGYQIIEGVGMGIVFTAPIFPILAPLPLNESAHALALLAFLRNFAFAWGTTIGSTILQNELKKRLPRDFLANYASSGVEIAYAIIPSIKSLPEPLRTQVRVAYAESLRIVWFVMLGISIAGFLSIFLVKEIPMAEVTDEQWGIKEKVEDGAAETGSVKDTSP